MFLEKFKKKPALFGCSLYCCAMFLSIVSSVFAKKTMAEYNIPAWEVICIRQFAIVIILIPFMIKYKFVFFNKKTLPLNALRNIIYAFSTFLFYTSLQKIPVNEITGFQFFTPICASIMAIIFFKEENSKSIWIALLVCVVGAFIIKGNNIGHTSTKVSYIYYVLLIIFILMRAFTSNLNGKLAKMFDTHIVVFYTHTIMFLVSLCFCYQFVRPTLNIILILSFLGLIYLVEYILIYSAYKFCSVLTIQPFDFSKMLFSMILSSIILHEQTTINQILGSLIIIIGFCIMVFSRRTNEKKRNKKKK